MSTIPPAAKALVIQASACTFVWFCVKFTLHPLYFALLCGILAAGLSLLLRQARWWAWIHLLFAPTIVIALALDLPPTVFLLAFILFALVYWSTFRTQVPLYLSSKQVWQALEQYIPTEQSIRVVDLGSGLGGVLHHLAKQRPLSHYVGVEYAPLPCLYSKIRLISSRQCKVKWASFWDEDLSEYDVVFAYLSPVPMAELWQKACREMRSGTLFISSTFHIPNAEPDEKVQLTDLHHSTLLIWRMSGKT